MNNLHERIMEIKKTKDTWMDMALNCNIDIKKFQNAIMNPNKYKLTQQELYSIYKYSSFNTSYNELLQIFNYNTENNFITRGEIYWVDFGVSNGSLQSGIRPALIISNNKNNKFSPTVQVVPITTASKNDLPIHVDITGCGLKQKSTILVEQIRTINKYELGEFIGFCSKSILQKVDKALSVQQDININTQIENISINQAIIEFIKYATNNVKTKDTAKFENVLLNQFNKFQLAGAGAR